MTLRPNLSSTLIAGLLAAACHVLTVLVVDAVLELSTVNFLKKQTKEYPATQQASNIRDLPSTTIIIHAGDGFRKDMQCDFYLTNTGSRGDRYNSDSSSCVIDNTTAEGLMSLGIESTKARLMENAYWDFPDVNP